MGCFTKECIQSGGFIDEYTGKRGGSELKSNAIFQINPGDYFPSNLASE
jgi:hypothetical protein